MVGDKLTSSYLKFGFNYKSSCNHAILTIRILQFSQYTLRALDISKAFDRVNFYDLMNVLMARRFSRNYIGIMYRTHYDYIMCWYWQMSKLSFFCICYYCWCEPGMIIIPCTFCSFHGQSYYLFEVVNIRLLLYTWSLLWVLIVCWRHFVVITCAVLAEVSNLSTL